MRQVAAWTVLIIAATFALAGCSDSHDVADPSRESVGSWRVLPAPPLSQVANALGVFTGDEVIYLGGDRAPCAPFVSCDAAVSNPRGRGNEESTRQAAAFNLTDQTWRRLAPVPAFVDSGTEAAFAAGHLFLITNRGVFDYDVHDDSWRRFHSRWRTGYGLIAVGDLVYGQTRDGASAIDYDVATGVWTRYPLDTITPRLGGLGVVATPTGPLLVGYDTSKPYNIHHGSPALVDTWDGQDWHRLPQTGQLERSWVWTGRRLVDPQIGTQDSGDEYTWDRAYPYGGTLAPSSGAWGLLPNALEHAAKGWVTTPSDPPASSGSSWFVTDGRVYNDSTRHAWSLPRPAGGPAVLSTGVWANGKLIAFGGATFTGQHLDQLSDHAWIYTP